MLPTPLPSPEIAWARIAELATPRAGTWVPRRMARRRVTAAAHVALVDQPPFDLAAMDGYACAGDCEPGAILPVAGLVAAGDPPGRPLPGGQSLRIMTGAPLPTGADRVVPVELTDRGRDRVCLRRNVAKAANVRWQGEVVRCGDELVRSGTPLSPAVLSLLAAHGYDCAFVHSPPSVALLTTGSEVVPPSRAPAPGQLRDSHSDFLAAALGDLDLAPEALGIARDEPEELAARIGCGCAHDVLLICGGVSAGELDFVPGALGRCGCTMVVSGVAMQPGKPLVVARHPGGVVFALPGNPASVMVAFWLFVRPFLRRLLGFVDGFWQGALTAELAAPLAAGRDRDRFLPAELRRVGRGLLATPIPDRGSHDLVAYARGGALLRIPPGGDPRPTGAACEVLPLNG